MRKSAIVRRVVSIGAAIGGLFGCGFLLSAFAALNSPADGDLIAHSVAVAGPFAIGITIFAATGYGLWRFYVTPRRRRSARRQSGRYGAPRRPTVPPRPAPDPRPPAPGVDPHAPTLDRLKALSPYQFEEFIRILVEQDGYQNVQRVGGAGDEGIDLRMQDAGGALWVIQCKRYKKTVAPEMVREFYGAMVHSQAQRGYLITTGTVSDNARAWIGDKELHILDGTDLIAYAQTRLGDRLPGILTQISRLPQ
jgi:hypothetical protein